MKTWHLNLIAGILALACMAALGAALRERQQAVALARAISSPSLEATADEDPRVTLARGLLQARSGEQAKARTTLQLALQRSDGALQNLVRYNLGNLALREALAMNSADEKRGPMLELAKQHYRDAMLRTPDDLAARYNLERALWMAPEQGIAEADKDQNTSRGFQDSKSNEDTTDEKERAVTTMKAEGGGLP